MSAMVSQITSLAIVCSTVYSGADQIKHLRSASLAFVRGIHRSPVNSPPRGQRRWIFFPFDDTMVMCNRTWNSQYIPFNMMTSSNGNIFRVTGRLCGEFTGPRWIPCTKASDAELWCFLWSTYLSVIGDATAPMWRHWNDVLCMCSTYEL